MPYPATLPEIHAEIRHQSMEVCWLLLPVLEHVRSRSDARRLAGLARKLACALEELACEKAHPAHTNAREIRAFLSRGLDRGLRGPLRPALVAADLLLGLWAAWIDGVTIAYDTPPPLPGNLCSLTIPTRPGGPSGIVELTAAQAAKFKSVIAAENARQASGLPPSEDCPMCKFLGAPHDHGVASA